MKKKTIQFLSLVLIMALAVKAQSVLLFELDFDQDGSFENCWVMQLNDVIKVDIYTSNTPSPGLISIGIDLLYDPVKLQIAPETEVDMVNWDVAPQIIFEEGEVEMKGGRLLPGLEGDRRKLGTVVLKCINLGLSELRIYDSDRQGTYDDFVLSDGTVLDGELDGGILVANVNNLNIKLDAGWSMISLPIVPVSLILSDVFPGAVVVYRYERNVGYVRIQEGHELEVGKGYWILLNEAKTYTMTGEIIDEYNLSVQDGWYMIGGCTLDAKASGDNCNIGVIYGYEQGSGYKRVQEGGNLKHGKGYWIFFENATDQAILNVQGM
jgi:hypothetical protein